MQDNEVLYSNQPIGIVVADTLEQAIYAASLVKTTYDAEKTTVDLHKGEMYTPKQVQMEPPVKVVGDPDAGRRAART